MPAKTQHKPFLNAGEYKVEKVIELNFFDLTGNKSKTKGSSNKSYHAELHLSSTDFRAQIYTLWGPTGGKQTEDWRHYDSHEKALKEFNSIIKSKIKKGYKEIDVAQRAYGSEEAKQITKTVELKNTEHLERPKSNLHIETQRLIATLMGATNDFVIQTLKCPLGQLTNNQIDEGRLKLNEAKKIINKYKNKSFPNKGKDFNKIHELTNEFYTLIPHNLGVGARGQLTHLLLDDLQKINQKEYDLDTLLDAKSIGAVLANGSNIDDQYKVLNTDFTFIEHKDKLFDWVNRIVLETRAKNHNFLGKIKVLNVWKIKRFNEFANFFSNAEKIANQCGEQVVPDIIKKFVHSRNDIEDGCNEIYKKANILPLFHGTKTQNLPGILKNSLLIRPAGVSITGGMFGNSALYFSTLSSKSINYTNIQSSYWAKGNDKKAYLFLIDCALGKQKIAERPYQFTKENIKPNHSVWAKANYSGIINDEFMVYDINQHYLRYLIEFTCQEN